MAAVAPAQQSGSKRLRTVIFLALVVVVPVAVLVYVFGFRHPSPGKAIAETNITSGQSFTLSYVADGNDNRVWLDLDCEYCGRFGGVIAAQAGTDPMRAELDEDVQEYGYTHTLVITGNRLVADGHLLLEMPPRQKGTAVTVSGTINIRPGGPGQQRIHKLRLWVAD